MGLASQSARSGSRRAYMSSGRRRRRPVWRWVFALLAVVLLGWWWLSGDDDSVVPEDGGPTITSSPNDTLQNPEVPIASRRGRAGITATADDETGAFVTFEPTPSSESVEISDVIPETTSSTGTTSTPAGSARPASTATKALQQAVRLMGSEPVRARYQLTQAWLAGLDEISRATAIAHARRLATVTLLDCREPAGSPFLVARKVAPGESLGLIRQRDSIGFSTEFLARMNGMTDPNRIKAGQVLHLPRGDFDAVIDLSSRDLAIFQNTGDRRDLLLVVPIEIGRAGETPTGLLRVRTDTMRRRHHRIPLEARQAENRDDPAFAGLELIAATGGGAGDGRSIRLRPEDANLVFELLGAADDAAVEIRE